MASPHVIGWKQSHDALVAALDNETPRKVLDIPCGTGVLAERLRKQGWDVHCADVDPGNFQLHDTLPFTKVDLNRPLPFEDETFDVIVCANGLHRLFNPSGAVKEFARILKPNGTLYINVNNYASLVRRVRFLLYGSVAVIFDHQHFEQTISVPEANVRVPIVCSQIVSFIDDANLHFLSARPASVRWKERLLWPLGLVIGIIAHCASLLSKQAKAIRINTSRAVLFGGGYLLIKAAK